MGLLTAAPQPTFTITPFAAESLGSFGRDYLGAPASTAFPSANRAIFVPFRLQLPIIAAQLFVLNGTSATGNADVGIYSESGVRLVSSGSIARSGTSVIQSFDVADTQFGPGLFYLALAHDGTSTFFACGQSLRHVIAAGLAQMAAAFPLPATVTFATMANAYIPIVGLTTRTFV